MHLVGFIIRIFFDIFFDITVFAELHDTHLQNRIALQVIWQYMSCGQLQRPFIKKISIPKHYVDIPRIS